MRELRWVLLDCPIRQWQNSLVRGLFQDLIQLKLDGYRSGYPETVLPLDTTDFIGRHLIVCEVSASGRLQPVNAARTITWSRCAEFGIPYSGLTLAQNSKDGSHIIAVKRIMEECERNGQELSYESSWTMLPQCRVNRAFARTLKEMYTAMLYLDHQLLRSDRSILGGVLRFKTEKLFEEWGAKPLETEGRILPNIHVKSLVNEEVQMVHLEKFSPIAAKLAQKYKDYWRGCLRLVPEEDFSTERQAA